LGDDLQGEGLISGYYKLMLGIARSLLVWQNMTVQEMFRSGSLKNAPPKPVPGCPYRTLMERDRLDGNQA
jgi:hypothetical protein